MELVCWVADDESPRELLLAPSVLQGNVLCKDGVDLAYASFGQSTLPLAPKPLCCEC